MPDVLVVGAFGRYDPGAEALCAAFCRALAGNRVTVTSADPDLTRSDRSLEAIPATALAIGRGARRADLVVVAGGTVFKSFRPSRRGDTKDLLRSTAWLVANAELRRRPVAMIGVGAGVLASRRARSLTRWLVMRTDLLVLRDEESAAVLTASGIAGPFRVGADPAWVMLQEPVATGPEGNSITVVLSHLAGIAPSRLGAGLAPLSVDFQIRLQPWQGANSADAELAAEMRRRLDNEATIVNPPSDLDSARLDFAADRLVIASRYHALVAAAAAGTPALAITHEPRRTGLAALARRLRQPAVPVHASSQVLAQAIADALHHPPPAPAAVQAERTSAEQAFTLLRLLVTRGDLAEPGAVGGLRLSNGVDSW